MKKRISLLITTLAVMVAMCATTVNVSAATGLSVSGEGAKYNTKCIYPSSENGTGWAKEQNYKAKTKVLRTNYVTVGGKKYAFQWKKSIPKHSVYSDDLTSMFKETPSCNVKTTSFDSMRKSKVYATYPSIKGYRIVSKKDNVKGGVLKKIHIFKAEKWFFFSKTYKKRTISTNPITIKKVYKNVKGKKVLWQIRATYSVMTKNIDTNGFLMTRDRQEITTPLYRDIPLHKCDKTVTKAKVYTQTIVYQKK